MANENMTQIALVDGTPKKSASMSGGGANPVVAIDTKLLATTPATGGTITLTRVPVDAKIASIMLAFDDLGTSAPADLGFYKAGSAGATAVDIDAMASAIAMGTAQTTWAEYRFEAANISTADQPAWELAGLSARPDYGDFDIVLTFGTVSSGAVGDVSFKVEYLR
jgi:hypothetical protein